MDEPWKYSCAAILLMVGLGEIEALVGSCMDGKGLQLNRLYIAFGLISVNLFWAADDSQR